MKVKILRCPYFSPGEDSHRLGTSLIPPLGMAQAVAYLKKKKFDIEQDDLNIKFHRLGFAKYLNHHGTSKTNIKKVINNLVQSTHLNEDTDVIILSVYISGFGVNDLIVKELAITLKQKFNCKLIIGGNQLFFDIETYFPLLRDRTADFVIKGGCQLIEKALLKKKNELKSVEGIAFEDHGVIFFKDLTLDAHHSGVPDFSGLPLELYRWNPDKNFRHPLLDGINKKPNIIALPISFIQGCNNTCAFCSSSSNQRLYYLEPKKVVDLLEVLNKKYSTPFFMFLNNMINFSKKYAWELCEEITTRELKIFWSDSVSSHGMDNKTLKLMKNAGCIRLYFGLETASQKLLDYVDKKISLSEFSSAIKYSAKLGIWNGVELIPGLPYETEEDISQTIEFINKHEKYIDELTVSPFYISEFSRFYNEPEKFGLKINKYKLDVADAVSYYYFMSTTFDEINGLKWSEKKKQIDHSYLRIISETKIPIHLWDERFFFLCWLYSNGYSKNDIKKIYGSVHPKILRKQYANLPGILKRVSDIKSLSDLRANLYLLKKFI